MSSNCAPQRPRSDYGLIGEAVQKVDLAIAEGPRLGARNTDRADSDALAKHGHHDDASVSPDARHLLDGFRHAGFGSERNSMTEFIAARL